MAPVQPGNLAESQRLSLLGNDLQAQCAIGSQHSIGVLGGYTRFEIRPGDIWELDPIDKERAELFVRDGTVSALPFDEDIWLSFALRVPSFSEFPAGEPGANGIWCIFGQIHSTNTPNPGDHVGLSPPWCQDFTGGKFTIQTRAIDQSPVPFNPPPVLQYEDDDFPRDTWVAFVYRFTFDPANGSMQVWRDGVSIFDAAIALGYDQPDAGYLKFGCYRGASPVTTVVEYANLEVGTNDLSGRIADPLANPY